MDNTDTLKILGVTLDCKLLLLFAAHLSEKVKKLTSKIMNNRISPLTCQIVDNTSAHHFNPDKTLPFVYQTLRDGHPS